MAYFSVFEINVTGVIVQNKLILFIVISHDKVIRLSSLATDEDIFFFHSMNKEFVSATH